MSILSLIYSPEPQKPKPMIATAVLSAITTLCALSALICGIMCRLAFWFFSSEKSFQWYDDHSKLSGAFAGFFFAVFFVAFVFKPYERQEIK